MKNIKLLYGFLIIVGVLFITLVSGILINTFSDGTSSYNLTFTGDENISRNISIPYNALVDSATMNLSGFEVIIEDYCYQESSNTTNQSGTDGDCDLDYSGDYVFSASSPTYTNNAGNMIDGDWETFGSLSSGVSHSLIITYYKPQDGLTLVNATWAFKISSSTRSILLPMDCRDAYTDKIKVKLVYKSLDSPTEVYCDKGSEWHYFYQTGTSYIYEEGMYWKLKSFPSSPYIQINNTQIWNHTGEFNSTFSPNKTSDFASVLNTALNGGLCDCDGCVLDGTDCLLSTLFHSSTVGKILYDAINIPYTPAPFVTLESPSNNSYSPATKEFNCSATDEIQLNNITFYFWNSTGDLNLSNTIPLTGTSNSTTYEMTFNSTDTFTWGCSATNNNSRSWWADDNWTINVDTTYPLISLIYPTNTSYNTIQTQLNFSRSDTNLSGCWYSLDSGVTNSSYDASCLNITGLDSGQGSKTWTVYANDSVGNENSSSVTFFVDSILPSVNIEHPHPQTYSYNESLELNYTVTDTNLESCWYKVVNSTSDIIIDNTTLTDCLNTTFNVPRSDTYTLTLYSNDSLSNENSDTVTFQISLASPSIVLDYPTDNLWLTEKDNVYFNFTATDSDGLDICELWINSTGTWHKNVTFTGVISGTQNYTQINLAETKGYIWNVWCNDSVGLENWALSNYTFNVDTINPLIEYTTGTESNNTNHSRDYIFVNVSASDTNENNIKFLLSNSITEINSTTYTTQERQINWTDLPDEIYTYNVTITDDAGRSNTTTLRTITLDTTAPTIDLTDPKTQNYADNNSIELNYTVADSLIGIDSCWYKVINSTGDEIISNTTLPDCLNITFSLPGGDIDYTLTLYSNDSVGNENSSSVTFGIRTVSPVIVLSPTNNTHSNRLTDHYFNFTVTTNSDSIDTCQLWGNFNGTWLLNQTLTSPVYDGSNNNFSAVNLTEGDFLWNVWCNDSLSNSGWALNNLSFTTDTTDPSVNITSPTNGSSSSGSTQAISYSTTDTNIDTCYFTLKDSTGAIHNYAENTSLNCSATSRSISILSYGTYTMYIYADDKADNTGTDQVTFTLTEPSTPGGSGGGGSPTTVSVVSLKATEDVRILTDLQRAIIYAKIYELQEDGLTIEEKTQIIEDLKKDSITLTITELTLLYNQMIDEQIENIKVSESIADRYNLIKTILVFPFEVEPRLMSGDTSFVCAKVGGEVKQFKRPIKSNKLFESCEVTQGNWQCEVSEDKTTAYIIYDFKEPDFFIQTLEGEVKYISHEGEVDYTRVISMNIINVCHETQNIRTIYFFILGFTIISVGGFIFYRKRKNYKGKFLERIKLKRLFKK